MVNASNHLVFESFKTDQNAANHLKTGHRSKIEYHLNFDVRYLSAHCIV